MGKKYSYWFIRLPLCSAVLFVMWFIPWVFVLKLGTLFYFPYEPNGSDRYLSVTGPLVGLISNRWIPGNNIPEFCKQAAVAAEDGKFYEHYGIDIESIQSTLKANKRAKKIKRGGSTITQQLVKNAFLSRNKSYIRKSREIAGAVLLNLIMSKDSQLTWYLNIIEFGKNIYGIEDAAHFYFKKDARFLTPSQCLALTTIIPSPKKWNKSLLNKNLSPFFLRRYHVILNNMKDMALAKSKNIYLAQEINLWSHQKTYTPPAPIIIESSESEEDENDED